MQQFIKVDVTDATQVESFFNQVFFLIQRWILQFLQKMLPIFQIREKFGRPDVIVNNAGILRHAGKLCEFPLDLYHDIINVNQHGAWYTLKYSIVHEIVNYFEEKLRRNSRIKKGS